MIMIRLMGGLGNQMFQYAFGRSLAQKYHTELLLDDSLLRDKSSDHSITTHRNFELDVFKNLHFRWATPDEVFLFNGDPKASTHRKFIRRLRLFLKPKQLVIQNNNQLKKEYYHVKGDTCFVGRWQSYKLFNENSNIIKNDFKLENPAIKGIDELTRQIHNTTSICLHVRRGDLLTSSLYSKTIGALELDYYNAAISYINSSVADPHYFVFSDDIEWCKKNITTNAPLRFVEQNFSGIKAEGHLYLMIQCKHFIISNSTFAWWGAYLSNSLEKKVVYPVKWFKNVALANPDMCPPNWTAK